MPEAEREVRKFYTGAGLLRQSMYICVRDKEPTRIEYPEHPFRDRMNGTTYGSWEGAY